jgi:hypothetical protein
MLSIVKGVSYIDPVGTLIQIENQASGPLQPRDRRHPAAGLIFVAS